MIRTVILALFLASSLTAFAQSDKNAASAPAQSEKNMPRQEASSDTPAALAALENKWVEALQQGDAATLDSVLAATFVDTDEEGQRTSKHDLLSTLKSGDLKFKSLTLADMQVHAYGNTAVVTGTATQDGAYKGQPLPTKIAFTDTFIKHDGAWKAVASHRSALQAAARYKPVA
ncbi:MAG: hypothetical protein NVS9B14_21330 [Candidatus Acidiferrum sp.]